MLIQFETTHPTKRTAHIPNASSQDTDTHSALARQNQQPLYELPQPKRKKYNNKQTFALCTARETKGWAWCHQSRVCHPDTHCSLGMSSTVYPPGSPSTTGTVYLPGCLHAAIHDSPGVPEVCMVIHGRPAAVPAERGGKRNHRIVVVGRSPSPNSCQDRVTHSRCPGGF